MTEQRKADARVSDTGVSCRDHLWREDWRHENEDRIRVRQSCLTCPVYRYGCFSKRPDDPSWGRPAFRWNYSSERRLGPGEQLGSGPPGAKKARP